MNNYPAYNNYNIITVNLNNLRISNVDDWPNIGKYKVCDINGNFHTINERDYDTLRKVWLNYDRDRYEIDSNRGNRNIVKIYLSKNTNHQLSTQYSSSFDSYAIEPPIEKPKLNLKLLLI